MIRTRTGTRPGAHTGARIRTRLATLAVICALALAGCGSSGKADPGGASAGAGGLVPVTLAYSAWPGWFPWKVAEEQGLFAKNGLNVTLKYFDSYTDSLNALATGNVTANSQTLNDTLASVSGGSNQTIVLVNDNSTGNDRIIAAPGITSVADLKGKKVAAEEGTVDHYLLLLALQKAGLSASNIDFVPLATDAAAAAFVAGRVDAVGVFAPFTTTALKRPGSTTIASSSDFPGAIPDHLVFGSDFVAANPATVQAVVQTWFDTLAYIQANKAQAITIEAKQAGVTVAAYMSYDAGTSIFTRAQNLEAFASGNDSTHLDLQAAQISDFLLSTKLIDAKPSLNGLLNDTFVKAAAP